MKKLLLSLFFLLFSWSTGFSSENPLLCPLCKIELSAPTQFESDNASSTMAIDGQPIGLKLPPLPECLLCGGAFAETAYGQSEVEKLKKALWSKDFQQKRQHSSRFRHALLLQLLGRSSLELAQAWLEVAWTEKAELRKEALQKSATQFENYLLSHVDQGNEADLRLKLADIYRQLGKFSQAQETLEPILSSSRKSLNRVIRLEQQLISEGNSESAVIPDGNQLHQAIHRRDHAACEKLSQQPELLNEEDLKGRTPLVLAIELRAAAITKILLKAGADPDRTTTKGFSATQMTVRIVFPQGLRLLIERRIDAAQRDPGGNNLLHLACAGASPERETMVKILLTQPIDINQRNFADFTPFHIAAANGSETMLKLLAGSGAKINARLPDGSSALFICRRQLIRPLIAMGVDLRITNNKGLDAFSLALLHSDGARISEFKKTEKFGKDFSSSEMHLARKLWQAIDADRPDQVKNCIKEDRELLKVKEYHLGESALHQAVLKGQLEIAALLLESGANPDQGNDFARTPLHYAATKGDIRMVKLFTNSGANIFALDIRGSTPLHDAAAAGAKDVYDLLIDLGASDSTKNNAGQSSAEILSGQAKNY